MSHTSAPPGSETRLPPAERQATVFSLPHASTTLLLFPIERCPRAANETKALTRTRASLGLGRLGPWVAQKTEASLAVCPAALGRDQEDVEKPPRSPHTFLSP